MAIKPLPQVPVLSSDVEKTTRKSLLELYRTINQIITELGKLTSGS
jgi:hypothetical protein